MRYGIFSDVHGNLEAIDAVLEWLKTQSIDQYIFLGDIVGYGANPKEVIFVLKELGPICIAGNHDWATVNKFNVNYFNPHAKEAIFWTREVLEEDDLSFLEALPLVYEGDKFLCVHGNLWQPEEFNYILNPQDALLNFKIMERFLCFIGHSHLQEVYILNDDKIFYFKEEKLPIQDNAKYIINVGSVGQPRDRDKRAAACVYDTERKEVILKRLDYDIKKAADKIMKAKLPPILANRLFLGY